MIGFIKKAFNISQQEAEEIVLKYSKKFGKPPENLKQLIEFWYGFKNSNEQLELLNILNSCGRMNGENPMSNFYLWTIYKHPKDYPDSYVARKFVGETPTNEVIVSKRLETIQDELDALGLVKLSRMPGDDPTIVETWM